MPKFGTYEQPFAADSLWNSRPIKPVLGTWVIPPCFNPRGSTNKMFPAIQAGAWSTGIYRALPTDPPRTIFAPAGKAGILDSDSGEYRPSITIPHWPADAVGAAGGDGHCDIIDEAAGVIHSFWILKPDAAGRFTAFQYSWSPLAESGFGTPAHFSQGARATGVPTCAGMIRKHEVADGKPLFEHALACSLDQSGLAASPAFIPPATMSDWNPEINTGKIPQGALLMLPPGYDTARAARWPLLKKVAETLKVYGARVVDRNEFTPYAIYVENGASWDMSPNVDGWDNGLAAELDYIRTQLRQVMSQDGFQAGHEDVESTDNLLSLRGPWRKINGSVDEPLYETLKQGLALPAVKAKTWYCNTSGLGFRVADLKPKTGECFRLSYSATNKSYFRMLVKYKSGGVIKEINVAPAGPDQFAYVRWPLGGWHELYATSPDNNPAGVLTAQFEKISEAEYLAATK